MKAILAIWLPLTFTLLCLSAACYISIAFLIVAVFGLGDIRARLSEYIRHKGTKSKRVLYVMQTSACQRYAAIAAFHDRKAASCYYRQLGYRWYHLLPNGTFSIKNNCYLKLSFYKKLLGIK